MRLNYSQFIFLISLVQTEIILNSDSTSKAKAASTFHQDLTRKLFAKPRLYKCVEKSTTTNRPAIKETIKITNSEEDKQSRTLDEQKKYSYDSDADEFLIANRLLDEEVNIINKLDDLSKVENKISDSKEVYQLDQKLRELDNLSEDTKLSLVRPVDPFKIKDEFDPEYKKEDVSFPEAAPEYLVNEINHYVPFANAPYCYRNCGYCSQFGNKTTLQYSHGESENTKAMIAIDPERKEIILAYRGSETSQLLSVSTQYTIKYPNVDHARVHYIYNKYFESLKEDVTRRLNESLNANPDFRIVITGHSMGGSLATLAAPQLHNDLNISYTKMRVITYGQPRIGNSAFAHWYNQLKVNFTRVVNENDPAPDFPSRKDGWSHVHQEVYIYKGEYLLCNTTRLEHPHCSYPPSSRGFFWELKYSHRMVGKFKAGDSGC